MKSKFNRPIYWILALIVASMALIEACQTKEDEAFVFNDLKIKNISPVNGIPGNLVFITGERFGEDPSQVKVTFNGMKAPIDSLTPSLIVVRVPEGATTGKIAIEIGKRKIISEDFFILEGEAPVITNFSPAIGRTGDEVTLEGEFFGETPEANVVAVNGTPAKVLEASATRLRFVVPAGASTGKISVTTRSRTGASEGIFEYIPPAPEITQVGKAVHPGVVAVVGGSAYKRAVASIASIKDFQVDEGDYIFITGKNFTQEAVVYFNKVGGGRVTANYEMEFLRIFYTGQILTSEFDAWNDSTRLVVRVPIGAVSGKITFRAGKQEVESQETVQVKTTATTRRQFVMGGPYTGRPINRLGFLQHYRWQVGDVAYFLDRRSRSFYGFNITTGLWTELADFGARPGVRFDDNAVIRQNASVFTVKGRLYLVGGRENSSIIDVWEYTPTDNSWRRKQDFQPEYHYPFADPDPDSDQDPVIPFRLVGATGFHVGDRGYIAFNIGNTSNRDWILAYFVLEDQAKKDDMNPITEFRRMWQYNPDADNDYNTDPQASKKSLAWTEVSDAAPTDFKAIRNNPAVPLDAVSSLFLSNSVFLQGQPSYLGTIGNKIYFKTASELSYGATTYIEFTKASATATTASGDNWERKSINDALAAYGKLTDVISTNPQVNGAEEFNPEGATFEMAGGKFYYMPGSCVHAIGRYFPNGGDPILEIDPQTLVAVKVAGFGGEEVSGWNSVIVGNGNRLFIHGGAYLINDPLAGCVQARPTNSYEIIK